MVDMKYYEPVNVNEAVSLFDKYKENAKVVAGGTDLVVSLNNYYVKPKCLINLNTIPDLDHIKFEKGQGVKIGALATISSLRRSKELKQKYPMIYQAANQFANPTIRNMATVGGNLCNAAPSADMAPSLVALGAKVKIAGPNGERIILLEDFFAGAKKTVLQAGEILVEIQVPELPPNTRGAYIKYAMKSKADLPVVGVAVVATVDKEKVCQDVKIVLSNVASTPIRARSAEDLLKGKKINDDLIAQCGQAAYDEARPRAGSFRVSAEYKKEMAKVFTGKLVKEIIVGG